MLHANRRAGSEVLPLRGAFIFDKASFAFLELQLCLVELFLCCTNIVKQRLPAMADSGLL